MKSSSTRTAHKPIISYQQQHMCIQNAPKSSILTLCILDISYTRSINKR